MTQARTPHLDGPEEPDSQHALHSVPTHPAISPLLTTLGGKPMIGRSASAFTAIKMIIPAMVVIALATAQSAAASTPLTGETLNGAGTTSNSSGGNCGTRNAWGTVAFSVSGQAAGPFPGNFVATGNAWLSGPYQDAVWQGRESATFTISSGATIITGTLLPRSGAFGGFGCSANGVVSFNTLVFDSYTAVINGQTYQGNVVRLNSAFDTSLAAQPLARVGASFTN